MTARSVLFALFPDLSQYIDSGRGYPSEIVRTYVQEVVYASFLKSPADGDDLVRALPVVVEGFVAPCVVECRRALVETCLRADSLVFAVLDEVGLVVAAGVVVAPAVADARVDETVRLIFLDLA